MPDIRVRFVGESNLGQEYKKNLAYHENFVKNIKAANQLALESAVGSDINRRAIDPRTGKSGFAAGTTVAQPARVELDKQNNVIRSTVELYKQLNNGVKAFMGTEKSYLANLDSVTAAEERLQGIQQVKQNALQATKAQIRNLSDTYRQYRSDVLDTTGAEIQAARVRQAAAQYNYAQAQTRFRERAGPVIQDIREQDTLAQGGNLQARARASYLRGVLSEIVDAERGSVRTRKQLLDEANNDLRQATRVQAQALESLKQSHTSKLRDIGAVYGRFARGIKTDVDQARAAITAAYSEPLRVPQTFRTIAKESPQLTRRLIEGGLGGGATDRDAFAKNLFTSGAAEQTQITRDLTRQVTRVTSTFTDQTGALATLTAEYDKSGRVITRFGAQQKGLGSILTSLRRDFEKVLEFAVATTVVFGAFQKTRETITTINDLDKSLRQFTITAQFTRKESLAFFDELATIGIATATPLSEIVKAADDIALAVRQAGQSTEEYRLDILALAEAVGILTNLSGIDTVKATDLLTSTMKQLGLEATDVIDVLNKVTAVAGGQSTAIADIVQGLGVMAEAGKQAGLTIDQQIAAVQTLSQVTSKSPAEVATAFKNLVGSLDSRAAVKALANYNIQLRDEEGNLRNILEIYGEINEKREQGIIPEADVKGLVKAIAGGPRRAPDAAALLGAIESISAVTERSINATNDALVANAQILDSTQSKLVQLQAAFDRFAFGKFAEALNVAAGSVFDVLNGILGILDVIPTDMYVLVLSVAALGVAAKVLSSTFGLLFNSMKNVGAGFKEIASGSYLARLGLTSVNSAAAQGARVQNRTATGQFAPGFIPVANETSRARTALGALRPLGGVAGASLLGAGVAAATKQDLAGIASSALTTAGAFALFAQPIPIIKALGAGALALGAAFELLAPKVRAAGEVSAETAQSILASINRYEELQDELRNVTNTQAELAQEIDLLTSSQQDNVDAEANLITKRREFAESTVQLIDLNTKLTETTNELGQAIAGIPAYNAKIQATGFAGGLQEIIQEATRSVLQATNPNFPVPEDYVVPPITVQSFKPVEGDSLARFAPRVVHPVRFGGTGIPNLGASATTITPTMDLSQLENDTARVKDLFDATGKEIVADFAATTGNIKSVTDALEAQRENLGESFFEQARSAVQIKAAQENQLANAQAIVTAYSAQTEAAKGLGLIEADRANQIQGTLALYQKFNLLGAQLEGLGRSDLADSAARFATENLFNGTNVRDNISRDQALAIGKEYFSLAQQAGIPGTENINLEDTAQMLELTRRLFIENEISVKGFTDEAIRINEVNEAYQEFQSTIAELSTSNITGLAGESANLRSRFMSGDIDLSEYENLNGALQELITTWPQVASAAEQAGTSVLNVPSMFGDALDEIAGLEDAQLLTTTQLIERVLSLGQSYSLSAEDVAKMREALLALLQVTSELSVLEERAINLGVNEENIDKTIAKLRQLAEDQDRLASSGNQVRDPKELRALADALEAAHNEGIAVANDLTNIGQAADGSSAALNTFKDALNSALDSSLSSLAQQSAQLEAQLQGGDIEPAEYGEQQDQLEGLIASLERLRTAAEESGEAFMSVGPVIGGQLSSIAGLQDAASLSTDQLVARLFQLADTYGLTGDQVVILTDKIIRLIESLRAVSQIRARFGIKAEVDATELLALLRAKKAFLIGEGRLNPDSYTALDKAIDELLSIQNNAGTIASDIGDLYQSGQGTNLGQPPRTTSSPSTPRRSSSSAAPKGPDVSTLDLPEEIANAANRDSLIQEAIRRARALQAQIPGAAKEAQDDIVELLKGTQRILEVRGVKDDLLRKALEELADIEKKRLEFETKADTIRRIRVGSGSFAALANVPLNTQTGVSVGGPEGPITVNLNINGQLLTPAQFQQLADQIGAAIKRQIGA